MPGPKSTPNPDYKRDSKQFIPHRLVARVADWEKTDAENKNSKLKFRKPGSQK